MEENGWNLDLLYRMATVVIPVLTFTVTQAVKKWVGFIPNEYLPIVALVFGAIFAALGQIFPIPALDGSSIINGALLGAGATGVHQVVVQQGNLRHGA